MNHRDSSARKEWAAHQAVLEAKILARRHWNRARQSCRDLVPDIKDYSQYAEKKPAAVASSRPEAPAYPDASPHPMQRRIAVLRGNGNRPRPISEVPVGRPASLDHWYTSPRIVRFPLKSLGFRILSS